MINVAALVQIKAFARQEGLFLALLWIASFLLIIYMPQSSWGNLMALSTPFYMGWRLINFRDSVLEGRISYRRGVVFSCYTFFYASLVFAIAQYVYFRFFDQGAMLSMLNANLSTLQEAYKAGGMPDDKALQYMKDGMDMIGVLSPIELSFIFMMQNLFVGMIISLLVALFCRKTKAQSLN